MSKKVICLTLFALLFALSFPAEAQQPKKIPRIGLLTNDPGPRVEAFRQGLRDLGYTEGKNIEVDYRYTEGKADRTPSFMAEFVQLKVDVVVSTAPSATRDAKQATKRIPIVMVITGDPVAAGLVDSLAHPGGNVTGFTSFTRDLSGKRLELLKEVLPELSRVGVLWARSNPTSPGNALKTYEAAAHILKIPLQSLEVRGPNPDFEGAFQAAAKERVSALITVRSQMFSRYLKQIAALAIKNRLPSMCEANYCVEAGGLMSYGSNDAEIFRRAATYVDKILKGANPADLPVEQPTKFELIINLKAAKQIGLTIPQSVLYQADKVIK